MIIHLWIFFFLLQVMPAEARRVDIRVAFGYKDARPARFVGDRYERLYILQKLTAPCPRGGFYQACGFERSLEDGNILQKTVTRKGEKVFFQLRITASSASADDRDNRQNTYQKYLSQISQNNLIYGVRHAQALFYIGHSRSGGGPDFAPPRLLKNDHVAYSYYQKQQPGFKDLLASLKQKPKTQSLTLGLLSCDSTKHFEKKIHRETSSVDMKTTQNLLYYTDALEKTLQELSSFIEKNLTTHT